MTIIKNAPRPILGEILNLLIKNECPKEEFDLLIKYLKIELLK